MGYGDPGSYNPASLIPTPNIDAMAGEAYRRRDGPGRRRLEADVCVSVSHGSVTPAATRVDTDNALLPRT